jgi:hypothetical protein
MKKVIGWIIVIAIVVAVGYITNKIKTENREYNNQQMQELGIEK